MSPSQGGSQCSVDLMDIVVAIQSDMQEVLVQLPDGERDLLNELRQRCRPIGIPWRAPGYRDPVAVDAF